MPRYAAVDGHLDRHDVLTVTREAYPRTVAEPPGSSLPSVGSVIADVTDVVVSSVPTLVRAPGRDRASGMRPAGSGCRTVLLGGDPLDPFHAAGAADVTGTTTGPAPRAQRGGDRRSSTMRGGRRRPTAPSPGRRTLRTIWGIGLWGDIRCCEGDVECLVGQPAASSTSRRRAPVHRAVEIAPTSHGASPVCRARRSVPCGGCLRIAGSPRPCARRIVNAARRCRVGGARGPVRRRPAPTRGARSAGPVRVHERRTTPVR